MGKALTVRTSGPADTRRLAAAVAAALRPGDVVSLTGELGAGKTCFVQGAAAALGVTDPVTSPSFLLRRDYRGDVPVLHLDVYRLETLQEVVELGYADAADRDAVVFIEWGDAMSQLLPADHLEVELRLGPVEALAPVEEGEADEERRVTLHAHGDDWHRRLADLAPGLAAWAVDEAPAGEAPC
jgi:tRNA threonylcarbamoyladenosine biosynthesis protein TsaE